ncbi:hypothetical protein [Streptomyces hesseae]|uniref:Uncharacterized protein n=1 Tax=Streptomyces hesseae TaxID=3075519 RepID=A0ABU2T0C7_9ACTN|nr:hypothetical protein [Streptomyces sp. DSM 40473]MDT0453629.1 hypothetical protein [Streptomyces sp. DSM 40473]
MAELVTDLTGQAVSDGTGRISLHMAPKDDQILIVLLSHHQGLAPADEGTLRTIAARKDVGSCGTDTDPDGRSLWAVFSLIPPRQPLVATPQSSEIAGPPCTCG